MRIYEALILSCFVFRLILCDPVKDLARKTSRIEIGIESKDQSSSNNDDKATFANENKIDFENKTNAVNIEKPLPSFVWTSRVSVHVVYPDLVHDDISLRLADTVDGFIDCLFKGIFLQEVKATATISGCQGDETTYISIFSTNLPGKYMFSFDKNDTREIANPYLNLRNDFNETDYEDFGDFDDLSNRSKRNVVYEDCQYEEEDYDDDISYDSAVERPPTPLSMKIKLAFDLSLVDRLGTEDEARKYTNKVHEHGKEYMQNVLHPSLGTQIFLQVVESPRFIRKTWEPTRADLGEAENYKEDEPVPLIIMVATDDTDREMGAANTRKACDNEKGLAILKRRDNIMSAVITYLHEISHLFGVRHDEQEDRKNSNNDCTNTGIMSQIKADFTIEQRAQLEKYSTCSSARFDNWYQRYGKTCMVPGILNIDDNDAKLSLLKRKCKSVASVAGDILHSRCPKPNKIKNGIWSCSEDGVYCYPICGEGYRLNHPSKAFIKCRNNQWNDNPEGFRCACDFNYIPENAESLSCSGHSCQVTCKAGYSAPQSNEMTCLEEWSITPESLACTSNPSCQIPASPQHGIWLCKDGDCSCELSCAEEYYPSSGQEISYDLGHNTWSVEPGTFSCNVNEAQVLLITGGEGTDKSVEVFDPEGRCNIDLPDLPFGRMAHTAHYLAKTGDVLICGLELKAVKSCSCSKLVGQSFVHHSNMQELRAWHSGVVLDNKIYLIGGMVPPIGNGTTSMESLTSPAATWSTENVQLEEGRFGACTITTRDNNFLIIGGGYFDSERKPVFIERTQVVKYDFTTQRWTTLAPMLGGGRAGHSCLYLGNGLVLVAGGGNGPENNAILSSAQIYNINANTWITTGSLNKKRVRGAMVKLNGRVFFIGGVDETETLLDSLEEFHPRTNTWTLLEKRLKRQRAGFSATSVPKTSVGC